MALCTLAMLPGLCPAEVTDAQRDEVMHQISGRDLSLHPPAVSSMYLFPIQANKDGNARLEVRFQESLPATFKMILDGKVKELRDDGRGEDVTASDGIFCARVSASPQDLRTFAAPAFYSAQSGDLVALSAQERGGAPVPIQSLSASNSVSGFSAAATVDPVNLVDPEKAMLIRDPVVLNHYFRTTDPCGDVPNPAGANPAPPDSARAWSFGYLMTQMVNQSVTKITTSDFALKWLSQWADTQTVNGDFVKEFDGLNKGAFVARTVKAQWLKASGWTKESNKPEFLKMGKAPFRLLAIVNRFDKRTNTAFGGGSGGGIAFRIRHPESARP